MENCALLPNDSINFPQSYKCETCDKEYRRKSSLSRHILSKHEPHKILKLKLENENLLLKINMYSEQIKFLKRLILIQEHTVRANGHPPIGSSAMITNTNKVS